MEELLTKIQTYGQEALRQQEKVTLLLESRKHNILKCTILSFMSIVIFFTSIKC